MLLAEFSFLQQLFLNVTGPVVTAVVGTFVLGQVASKITRAAQERRENYKLRDELVADATEGLMRLYLATQRFWRAKALEAANEETLAREQKSLDREYNAARVALSVVEGRLEVYYYPSALPKQLCHRAVDLLTVRYFGLVGRATDRLLEINSGEKHSGLTVDELRDAQKVLAKFHDTLRELGMAILREPLAI